MLKSAVRMREMLFQRHKFQKISKGGVSPDPPSWTRLRVPCLEAACSSFAPGGKSACYASVNSEYTYRDFFKTPGFYRTSIRESMSFLHDFYWVSSVNFGTNNPPVEMPSVRHWIKTKSSLGRQWTWLPVFCKMCVRSK